jgi:hypothetical protein
MILTCNWELPSSNLGQDDEPESSFFFFFLRYFAAPSGGCWGRKPILKIGHHPLPSMFFPIHIVQRFDTAAGNSLNKA